MRLRTLLRYAFLPPAVVCVALAAILLACGAQRYTAVRVERAVLEVGGGYVTLHVLRSWEEAAFVLPERISMPDDRSVDRLLRLLGVLSWEWGSSTYSSARVGAPGWAVCGTLAVGAAALWWLPRRMEPVGVCTACGYPRAGLPPAARCPECGAGV